jgi:hypothetical protein
MNSLNAIIGCDEKVRDHKREEEEVKEKAKNYK